MNLRNRQLLKDMGVQFQQAHTTGPTLLYKKQLSSLLEKLKNGEQVKQYSQLLIIYIQNAIQNQKNHNDSLQKQIIHILLKLMEEEQYIGCETEMVSNQIISYLTFILSFQTKNQQLIQSIGNLVSKIYLKKLLFPIQDLSSQSSLLPLECGQFKIEFSQIEVNQTIALCDKSLQSVLFQKALQYSEVQEKLISFQQPELKGLVLQLAQLFNQCPFFPVTQADINNSLIQGNLQWLQPQEQLSFYINQGNINNQVLEQLLQIIINNKTFDFSQMETQIVNLISQLIQTLNIDYDKALLILRKLAKQKKYNINYEEIRDILLNNICQKQKCFINDIVIEFALNVEDIIDFELDQKTNHNNITNLVIKLLKPTHFPRLKEQLFSEQITPYSTILFHLLYLTQNVNFNISELKEHCLNVKLNNQFLILLFSYFSIINLNFKRKIKLLNAFQQLLNLENSYQFEDILVILGKHTQQREVQVSDQSLGQSLNKEFSNITQFIQQNAHQQKLFIIQGFYQIVMYFSDREDCEFLQQYQVIHDCWCNRNKLINLNKLLEAIKNFDMNAFSSKIYLYSMLLKYNYTLNPNLKQVNQSNFQEERSELSSEFGLNDINQEKELSLLEEIKIEIHKVIQTLDIRVKMLELSQFNKVTSDRNIYSLLELYRLINLSQVKVDVELEQFQKVIDIDIMKCQQECKIIWDCLKNNNQLVLFSTIIMQLFTNEDEVHLLKMIGVELNKLYPYNYLGQLWKNYDILYSQNKMEQQLNKIDQLKLCIKKFKLMLNYNNGSFLKIGYEQASRSKLEMLALFIAIGLECGIEVPQATGLGSHGESCINNLIVMFCEQGLIQLVLRFIDDQQQKTSSKKKKQRRNKIDVEHSTDYYLQDEGKLQELEGLVIQQLLKNLITNDLLKQEYMKLAQLVYTEQDVSNYDSIIKLFSNDLPKELISICLNSIEITDNIHIFDKKLEHLMKLMSAITYKFNLLDDTNEVNEDSITFLEQAYEMLSEYPFVSPTSILFSFQLINLIRRKDQIQTDESQLQRLPRKHSVDIHQLKEILVPETFQPSNCVTKQTTQQSFLCNQCPLYQKTIRCCANCAFGCHNNHDIEYDGILDIHCECGGMNPKKCSQVKTQKPTMSMGRPPQYQNLLSMLSSSDRNDIRRQHLELSLLKESNIQIWNEDVSERNLQESVNSDLSFQEDSNNNNMIMEENHSGEESSEGQICEDNEQEQKISKEVIPISKSFDQLKSINKERLIEKLIEYCMFAIQNYQNSKNASDDSRQCQEFELIDNQYDGELVKDFLHHKQYFNNFMVDVIDELSQQVENYQVQTKNYILPAFIRKIIDEADGIVAVAVSKNEVKLFQKQKLLQYSDKKPSNQLMGYQKILVRKAIQSLQFNPWNHKQLMICGTMEIYLYELRSDGTINKEQQIHRSSSLIGKVQWINQQQIAYLTNHKIVLINVTNQNKDSHYQIAEADTRWKDFIIVQDTILALAFNGNLYRQKIQESTKQLIMNQQVIVPENLKGKAQISYSIALINKTNLILISYKNGSSFLCQFFNNALINIVQLDLILESIGIDHLLSSPQLILQTKQQIVFSVLTQKHSNATYQYSFNRGKLLIIEMDQSTKKLKAQVCGEELIDNYKLIIDDQPYIISIHSNKTIQLVQLNLQGAKLQEMVPEQTENDNQDTLLNQLQEVFDLKLVKAGAKLFKPLQDFCLAPNTQATNQQIQISQQSNQQVNQIQITVAQGYCISGVVFMKSSSDQVEIFSNRICKKKSLAQQTLNVPLNYLEQIYSYLNHNITLSSINYESIQVFIQKLVLTKPVLKKLLQIICSNNLKQKIYVYQDINQRINKFKSIFNEDQIILINSMDSLGMILSTQLFTNVPYTLVQSLIELIQNNNSYINQSAQKLLKEILNFSGKSTEIGSQYHYKSIMDRLFIDKFNKGMLTNLNQVVIKLRKIGMKRLPQLYLIFSQNPGIITKVINEQVDYSEFISVLIYYLQYVLANKRFIDFQEIIQEIEIIKQQWVLQNQNLFNIHFQESIIRTYQFNTYKEVQQQNEFQIELPHQMLIDFGQKMEIEEYLNNQKIDSDDDSFIGLSRYNLEYDKSRQSSNQKHFQQFRQQSQQQQQQQQHIQTPITFYNLTEPYITWLVSQISKLHKLTKSDPKNSKNVQNQMILINQLYLLVKSISKKDSNNSQPLLQISRLIQNNFYHNRQISLLLLCLINSGQVQDSIWSILANKLECQINHKEIFKWLNQLQSEIKSEQNIKYEKQQQFQSSNQDQYQQQKSSQAEKLRQYVRDIIKYSDITSNQIIKLLEKTNQLIYVHLLKYQSQLLKQSSIAGNLFKEDEIEWRVFLFQAQLEQQTKQLAGQYIKQLLQQIVDQEQYHQIKDYYIYQSQMEILMINNQSYSHQQKQYQALNLILSKGRKRLEILKKFHQQNPNILNLLKHYIKQHPLQCLEIIELIYDQ